MKRIPLTRGYFALVDNEDYAWLMRWKWSAMLVPTTGNVYAVRAVWRGPHQSSASVYMHRQLLGLSDYDGRQVDHRNGNGIDNQRSNLRIVTSQENHWNRRGVKGYSWNKHAQKFVAYIKVEGKYKHLGCFERAEDARAAYVAAKAEYHRFTT